MTNNELNQYIYHYLTEDKTHSAIMLTGAWGTGKSYYIQNELTRFLKEKQTENVTAKEEELRRKQEEYKKAQKFKKDTSKKGEIEKLKKEIAIEKKNKVICVSLYGLTSLPEISKSIYLECRAKFLNNANEKIVAGKIAAKTVVKGVTNFLGIDLSKSDEEMQELYQSLDLSGKLIILEDLERSGIDILEVLGYVNNLVEQDGVKVLLVANENEILHVEEEKKKLQLDIQGLTLFKDQMPEQNKLIRVLSENQVEYKTTKEKTVSDTLLFPPYCEKSIEEILHSFNCSYFEEMLSKECQSKEKLVNEIISIMTIVKSFNLRSFVFGCQKTYDLFQYVDKTFDIGFLEYLLCSNVAFALRLKQTDNLQWKKDDENSSAALGTSKYPLLKVAFDYIKYQYCDKDELKIANDTYCRQKEYESNKKEIKKHLDVIYQYYELREKDVADALAQVTRNLETSEDIPCGEFGRLANYLVAIHGTIGHDDEITRCRTAMIKRIEKCDGITLENDIRFHSGIQLNSQEENEELSAWGKDMLNACKVRQQAKFGFDYSPENAEQFETDILKDRDKYVNNHVFARKLDIEKLIKMISASSPAQISSIRSAFLDVYSFSNLKDFFEGDKEALEKIKEEIDKLIDSKKNDDKIVLMQLKYFSGNLQSFIDLL